MVLAPLTTTVYFPLNPHARVLVAGDGADHLGKQTGGWTMDWQGDRNAAADFPGAASIDAGVKAAVEQGGEVIQSLDGHAARSTGRSPTISPARTEWGDTGRRTVARRLGRVGRSYLQAAAGDCRRKLGAAVAAGSVLGGLHHEYRLQTDAA
jgi:hypothetical protein